MEIVSRFEEVERAMRQLHEDLRRSPGLAGRLSQAHAFYVLPDENGENRFGFSKFLGYPGLTAEIYLNNYKNLDGRNTEHALKPWFEEVLPGSQSYAELYEELREWLATYGKKPRGGEVHQVRIMVPSERYAKSKSPKAKQNRHLVELLIEVSAMLTPAERSRLRAAI